MLAVVEWLRDTKLTCPLKLESAYALWDDGNNKDGNSNNNNKNGKKNKEKIVVGERLHFTNVTNDFVGVLDYIFSESPLLLEPIGRLLVPLCFTVLNRRLPYTFNGHVLPSDVWPSDHLAIGAEFAFPPNQGKNDDDGNNNAHDAETEEKDDKSTTIHTTTPLASQEVEDMLFCAPLGGMSSPPPPPPPPLAMAPQQQQQQQQPPLAHAPRCACGCVPAIPSMFEMAELRKKARLKKQREARMKNHQSMLK